MRFVLGAPTSEIDSKWSKWKSLDKRREFAFSCAEIMGGVLLKLWKSLLLRITRVSISS